MTPTEWLFVLVAVFGLGSAFGAAGMGLRLRQQCADAFTNGLGMGQRLRPRPVAVRPYNERPTS